MTRRGLQPTAFASACFLLAQTSDRHRQIKGEYSALFRGSTAEWEWPLPAKRHLRLRELPQPRLSTSLQWRLETALNPELRPRQTTSQQIPALQKTQTLRRIPASQRKQKSRQTTASQRKQVSRP